MLSNQNPYSGYLTLCWHLFPVYIYNMYLVTPASLNLCPQNSISVIKFVLSLFQPLLAVTSVVAGFSMCLLGVWFYLQSIQVFLPGWVPIVAMCVSIFADGLGLQPLPYVIMTEMFSFQVSKFKRTIQNHRLKLVLKYQRIFPLTIA